jgi:starch synthase
MKVVYASSEIQPFAATGGLADVASALPGALRGEGVDVCRVMPLYRHVMERDFPIKDTGIRLRVPLGLSTVTADVWVCEDPSPKTYFIRRDEYFDRSQLYGLPDRDYDDNAERFVFFQKSVVALIDALALGPDVVHCNDWQTGLLPLFLTHGIHGMGRSRSERTVFTIHNLAYQGVFDGSAFSVTNLPFSCFSVDRVEFYGTVNSLKGGLTSSDMITTVSTSYAEEIQTKEYGCGLEGVLTDNRDHLVGILNGVDYSQWNPETDEHLTRRYSARDLRGKQVCKEDLVAEFGLEVKDGTPLVGMISRLTEQKGLDILSEAMPRLMRKNLRFVLLGAGDDKYQDLCATWATRWPRKFAFRLAYDKPLSHKIEGGADIYLMPSRFEPCGLNQLYSLKYGTVPVVHATGGLKDTIHDVDASSGPRNGFVFKHYSAPSLQSAIDRALRLYPKRRSWLALVRRAMKQDYSWKRAAAQYVKLYKQIT